MSELLWWLGGQYRIFEAAEQTSSYLFRLNSLYHLCSTHRCIFVLCHTLCVYEKYHLDHPGHHHRLFPLGSNLVAHVQTVLDYLRAYQALNGRDYCTANLSHHSTKGFSMSIVPEKSAISQPSSHQLSLRFGRGSTLIWLCAFCLLCFSTTSLIAQAKYDTNSVIVTRALEKRLFEDNSVPFMQPLVTTLNSTSNSRFFNKAEVPTKVDQPYFRFSVNGMVGFVRDDQREYTPQLPTEKRQLIDFIGNYVEIDFVNMKYSVKDTAGLMLALIERLFQKGLENGSVTIPARAATIFGNKPGKVEIKTTELVKLLSTDPEFSFVYNALDTNSRKRIDSAVIKLPSMLALPPGQNMSTLFAAVPQLEIGSLYGTELLLRYIPPVRWDTSVGHFSFFGVAVKHSLSQYLNDPGFHMALQVGYQATHLTNTVGVTQAELDATAEFFDVNIHASKSIKGWFDLYTGIDYATVDIKSKYSYLLPQEVQVSLGLREVVNEEVQPADPARGYPGDNVIQVSESKFSDATFKWTFGVLKEIGSFGICLDYSVSKFNVFSAGLSYRF